VATAFSATSSNMEGLVKTLIVRNQQPSEQGHLLSLRGAVRLGGNATLPRKLSKNLYPRRLHPSGSGGSVEMFAR
jgi:hypothetical protein